MLSSHSSNLKEEYSPDSSILSLPLTIKTKVLQKLWNKGLWKHLIIVSLSLIKEIFLMKVQSSIYKARLSFIKANPSSVIPAISEWGLKRKHIWSITTLVMTPHNLVWRVLQNNLSPWAKGSQTLSEVASLAPWWIQNRWSHSLTGHMLFKRYLIFIRRRITSKKHYSRPRW